MLSLLAASFILLRTGRDALYLANDGLLALPRAYIVQAGLSIGQSMGMLALLGRLGVRAARLLALGSAVILGVAYVLYGSPGGAWPMTLLFVGVPLVFSVAFSLSWVLAIELLGPLEGEAKASPFARLGAASIVGGVGGGGVARAIGPAFGPRVLLMTGTVLVLLTLGATALAHRATPKRPRSPTGPLPRRSPPADRRIPALGSLIGVAMAVAMTGVLVDFQFYVGAAQGGEDARVAYLANAYLLLSAGSLVLQLVVTPWLTREIGPSRALLVLPGLLMAGGAAVLSSGTAFARAVLRVTEGGVKRGLHQSSWEQTLSVYPAALRPQVKILVDGMATRLAEGLAGAALLGWIHLATTSAHAQKALVAMGMGWVAELSAAAVTSGLVLAAFAGVVFTLFLTRRLRITFAAEPPTQAGAAGTEADAPTECCPVTMMEARRLLAEPPAAIAPLSAEARRQHPPR